MPHCVFAFVLVCFTVLAFAAQGSADILERWWRNPELAAKLDCDAALADALDALREAKQSELAELGAAVLAAQRDLDAAMENERLDEAAALAGFKRLNAARDAFAAARDAFAAARFEYFLDVRKAVGAERYHNLKRYYQESRATRKSKHDNK